ncbi:MAG: 50S ribosomal protein L23 [Anaerolineae bacterium]
MHVYEVLVRPILTEKGNYQVDKLRQYTFEVSTRANKIQVREAVETAFKVNVLDVSIMNIRGKQRRMGRHTGTTNAWKKAIVTLAQGQSISFFEGV